MRRTLLVPAALGAAVLLAVAAGTLLAARDGEEGRSPAPSATTPPAPPAPPRELDVAGRELVSVLAKGRALTFHARYQSAPAATGASLVVEVWRKDGLARQDTQLDDGRQVVRTAAIRKPDGQVSCRRLSEEPWTCAPLPVGASSADQLLGQVAGDLEGRTVTSRDDTVGGRAVRCFTISGEGQTSELCATPEGIPVLLSTAGARLELVELREHVDDSLFTPPA